MTKIKFIVYLLILLYISQHLLMFGGIIYLTYKIKSKTNKCPQISIKEIVYNATNTNNFSEDVKDNWILQKYLKYRIIKIRIHMYLITLEIKLFTNCDYWY